MAMLSCSSCRVWSDGSIAHKRKKEEGLGIEERWTSPKTATWSVKMQDMGAVPVRKLWNIPRNHFRVAFSADGQLEVRNDGRDGRGDDPSAGS